MSRINKRALIIDDEADARGVLRELLGLFCSEVSEIHEANNAREAMQIAQSHQFDLIFIDIEMGDESGLELAEHLFHHCRNLIFVTAHDNYAIEAYRTPAIHYLLKPVNPRHLRQALDKTLLLSRHEDDAPRILLHLREGTFIIKPEEITHIVGDGNYSTFHLKDGRSLVASKYLAYYEDLLDKNLFFRIHQSHLVNLNDVRQIDTQEGLFAIMTNGNKLPLARRRKEAFLKALA